MKTFIVALAYVDRAQDVARLVHFTQASIDQADLNREVSERCHDAAWLAERLDLDPRDVADRSHEIFDSGPDDFVVLPLE